MSEAPWIPFYTSDFLAGTGGMTASTKGVYITLLCLMYEAEEPLMIPRGSLARRCGVSNSGFKRALDDLFEEGKIEEIDGGLWSRTVEKHISYRLELRRQKSDAAKRRWEKAQQKQGEGDAGALRAQCKPKPKPKPHTKKEPPSGGSKKASPEGSAPAQDDLFGSGAVPEPIDDVVRAFQLWNEKAKVVGWKPVQNYTRGRRASVKQRLKELGGIEGWKIALEKASEVPVFCSEEGRFFGFDFFVKAEKMTKLMEGNYDDWKPKQNAAAEREKFLSAADRWDEEYKRRRGVPEHH
jgi:uncharacterized protein YdaU (DUF1376 family)